MSGVFSLVVATVFWISIGSIIYTYFGYPLLVTLLSCLLSRSQSFPQKEEFPSVTLLIAAYNEEVVIEEKIKNSLAIDYPRDRYQILIVADGSSDRTMEIAGRYQKDRVELLYQPERRGKIAAINRALPFARGEIIVFSDANNIYETDTLKHLIRPFSDPTVGAVSGAKVIKKGDGNLGASEGLYWKYESLIKKQESRLASCTSAAGEILAIRKKNYVAPPPTIINDDFYIAMQILRQGYRMVYASEAISSERVSPTPKDEVIRRTRINAGRFQIIALAWKILPFRRPLLVWQIVSHKFLRPLVPFFMIGAAFSNLTAVLFPPDQHSLVYLSMPFSIIMLTLQGLFYLAALGGAWLTKQGKQGILARLLYLPAFLTNSNFAALKGLAQYLHGGNFHLWERIQRR